MGKYLSYQKILLKEFAEFALQSYLRAQAGLVSAGGATRASGRLSGVFRKNKEAIRYARLHNKTMSAVVSSQC